jgi:hypothetical protein
MSREIFRFSFMISTGCQIGGLMERQGTPITQLSGTDYTSSSNLPIQPVTQFCRLS